VPLAERTQKNADNCSACHMPRGDTEVPHVAFTHHRIGKHGAKAPPGNPLAITLVPIDENPHLGPMDRKRNLAVAYMEAYRNPVYSSPAYKGYPETFRARARELLQEVYQAGFRDAMVLHALAEITWTEENFVYATRFVKEALAAPDLKPDSRANCLAILAGCETKGRNLPAAATALEQLVSLRRFANDWSLLGGNYLEQGLPAKARPAFEKALAIRPSRPAPHLGLAETFRRMNDPARARQEEELGEWLRSRRLE
jgi:tetratricopeptide (TPR) repeat protein